MTGIASNRRPFRFGLGTLFVVVTLIGAALGWQTHRVHQRKDLLRWAQAENNGFGWGWTIEMRNDSESSWWRKLSGDIDVKCVVYPPGASGEEINRMKDAFPEAEVMDEWGRLEKLIRETIQPTSWSQ